MKVRVYHGVNGECVLSAPVPWNGTAGALRDQAGFFPDWTAVGVRVLGQPEPTIWTITRIVYEGVYVTSSGQDHPSHGIHNTFIDRVELFDYEYVDEGPRRTRFERLR